MDSGGEIVPQGLNPLAAVVVMARLKPCPFKKEVRELGGYGSLAGAAYGVGVLEEDAAFVAGCGGDEVCEAFGDLFVGDVEG